jgi:molybdate transport system substrate-binding protein
MNTKRKPGKLWLAAALLLLTGVARADEVSVAVAANFTEPMKKIAAEFEKTSGHKVAPSFGSTGKFYAQVKAGAPFEVLLAADDETPSKMEQEGMAVKGSHFAYAIGKLVLWSAKEAVVDGNGDILKQGGKQGSFEHIALANPKLAPYGAAGVQTLQALGVYDAVAPKIVQGENIAQTYQFIVTGNALLGFVALSQVIGEDGKIKSGSAWIVPQKYYTPIRQDAVLLDKGKDKAAALELLKFLKTPFAVRVIQSYGYDLPQ